MSKRFLPLLWILIVPLVVAPAGPRLSAEEAAGRAAGQEGRRSRPRSVWRTSGSSPSAARTPRRTSRTTARDHLPEHPRGVPCDQIFRMNLDGSNQRMVSNGEGRTTCGYFYPDGESIVYASTHLGSPECPAGPQLPDGLCLGHLRQLRHLQAAPDGHPDQPHRHPGYDAEATIGPDGRIGFMSVRDGDQEIYSMNGDGSDVRRLTHRQGPEAGRSSRPTARRSSSAGARSPTAPSSTTTSACSTRGSGGPAPSRCSSWTPTART